MAREKGRREAPPRDPLIGERPWTLSPTDVPDQQHRRISMSYEYKHTRWNPLDSVAPCEVGPCRGFSLTVPIL